MSAPKILTTIRATGGDLYKPGREEALALDYPRSELRRLQQLGAIENFVSDDDEPTVEPEAAADEPARETATHRTLRETRHRKADLAAQLEMVEQSLAASRGERAAALANGTADAHRRVPELDEEIERHEQEERSLSEALELLNRREAGAVESIRLADLSAAQAELKAAAALRTALLFSVSELTAKTADDLSALDAKLTATTGELQRLSSRIVALGGESASVSDVAEHGKTDRLRSVIEAARAYGE
jgi:hypothetical protein